MLPTRGTFQTSSCVAFFVLMAMALSQALGAVNDRTATQSKRSPEDWSDAELRAFRGAIATVRLKIPYGPRPDQSDNVLFTPMYGRYTPADRAPMRAAYKERGYTHWPIGPLITGTYHDQYPDVNDAENPDRFADQLEELWADGLVPVVFLLPLDRRCGLNADGMVDWPGIERVVSSIYRSPRFQHLAKIVVLAWEPDDGQTISSQRDWVTGVTWMANVFPNALRYVHFTAGHRAPCSREESEADGWRAVSPFIHGWLVQSGRFGEPGAEEGGASKAAFISDLSLLVKRLDHGADGWPTSSASSGRPLDVVAFEYASYWSYWHNRSEASAQNWGEAAMSVEGIAGFCDGGPKLSVAASK